MKNVYFFEVLVHGKGIGIFMGIKKKIFLVICAVAIAFAAIFIYMKVTASKHYKDWVEPLTDMIEKAAPEWAAFGASLIDMDFDNIPEVFVNTSSTAGAVTCNAYKFDGVIYKEWNLPEGAGIAEIILVETNEGEKRWVGYRFSAKDYYLVECSSLEPKFDGIYADNLLTIYGNVSDVDSSYITINNQSVELNRQEKEAISKDIPPGNVFAQKYIDDMWSNLGSEIEYKKVYVRNAEFLGIGKNKRSDIIKDILEWEKN